MKSYPCVGGPLDGFRVMRTDMQEPVIAQRDSGVKPDGTPIIKAGQVMREGGKFGLEGRDYVEFNRSNRFDKVPTMIWLYIPLLNGATR